jgi:hypothetical protein
MSNTFPGSRSKGCLANGSIDRQWVLAGRPTLVAWSRKFTLENRGTDLSCPRAIRLILDPNWRMYAGDKQARVIAGIKLNRHARRNENRLALIIPFLLGNNSDLGVTSLMPFTLSWKHGDVVNFVRFFISIWLYTARKLPLRPGFDHCFASSDFGLVTTEWRILDDTFHFYY